MLYQLRLALFVFVARTVRCEQLILCCTVVPSVRINTIIAVVSSGSEGTGDCGGSVVRWHPGGQRAGAPAKDSGAGAPAKDSGAIWWQRLQQGAEGHPSVAVGEGKGHGGRGVLRSSTWVTGWPFMDCIGTSNEQGPCPIPLSNPLR